MSHFYTVRQSSGNQTEVIVSDGSAASDQVDEKVTIVETVVETGENGETLVNSSERAAQPTDTVQLMGMASTLPSSNIFVNYPHTMWERDSEGNRIPVTVVKTEDTAEDVGQADLLGQATADIKTENDEAQTTTVITIPAAHAQSSSSQVVLTPTSAAMATGSGQQRIVVTKTQNASSAASQQGNGEAIARPHVCDVCTKTFAKREHLTKHLRIHKSDNKRYSCEYCQKAFRDRYELVRHTRRHTGDFPFR